MTASVLYERPANPLKCRAGTGRESFAWLRVFNSYGQDSDVYDRLVRLLRPSEDAPRLARARVRRDLARRRSRLPPEAARSDRWLDGPADPRRRAADRRLHRALAAGPQRRAREARRLSFEPLAVGAVPRAAACGADLVDRGPAAVARLAGATVDLELVLHPPARAARCAVVAEGRALPRDAGFQRGADTAVERGGLVLGQAACLAQRMDLRAPQRLIGVDVADP